MNISCLLRTRVQPDWIQPPIPTKRRRESKTRRGYSASRPTIVDPGAVTAFFPRIRASACIFVDFEEALNHSGGRLRWSVILATESRFGRLQRIPREPNQ